MSVVCGRPVGAEVVDGVDVGAGQTQGLTRLVRVAILAAASMGVASAAHLAGGGRLPPVALLGVVTLLVGLSAAVLTSRRCRFPVLFGALAVQQALLHVAFDIGTRTGVGCVASMPGVGHGVHVVSAATPASAACAAGGAMASMPMPGWLMWTTHLVATAVTAALLARGEAWLWRVADAIIRASTARPSSSGRTRPARPVALVAWTRPTTRASSFRSRAPPSLLV